MQSQDVQGPALHDKCAQVCEVCKATKVQGSCSVAVPAPGCCLTSQRTGDCGSLFHCPLLTLARFKQTNVTTCIADLYIRQTSDSAMTNAVKDRHWQELVKLVPVTSLVWLTGNSVKLSTMVNARQLWAHEELPGAQGLVY